MKALIYLSLILSVTAEASSMKQCDPTSKSEVSYESETVRVTFIQGDIAKKTWDKLSVEIVDDSARFGDSVYSVKGKYSPSLNCWQVLPNKYVNGQLVGPSDCLHYSCNIIERF